ncbi:MAG TPA: hypothetical protein VKY56_02150 [Chloroflexota bacterium]|nr:hypothetical protein [Chloroflexota bacterium]
MVERRNQEEGVLVALFPPDLLLAAGDSVDVSTFRVVPLGDLASAAEEAILAALSPSQRQWTLHVLADLRQRKWPVSPTSRLSYLATIAVQGSDDLRGIGSALFVLGLVPDPLLLERPDEFHYRLGQRNLPIVKLLGDLRSTPLERILRLPLSDLSFRDRLLEFFSDRPPEDVAAWGAVAATDPAWNDLTLDGWPMKVVDPPVGSVRIDVEPLKLPRRREDGVLEFDASGKTILSWQTTPPPIDVPGLAYFRVEVVNSDRVVVWETPLIKAGQGRTARRSRTVKDLTVLETGVYFFRVIALSAAGDPFDEQPARDVDQPDGKRSNESEDFLLVQDPGVEDPGEVEPVTTSIVRSFAEAELLFRAALVARAKDPNGARRPTVAWLTSSTNARAETASAGIQFGADHRYTVRVSQKLRRLEREILAAPESGGHCRLHLNSTVFPFESMALDLPPEFLAARRSLFAAMERQWGDVEGEPVTAVIDLCALAREIEDYAQAYRAWLDRCDDRALRLDVALVAVADQHDAALVAPTHPLRLLWALQLQQVARAWIDEAWQRHDWIKYKHIVDVWRGAFSPHALPLPLVLSASEGYLDAGHLTGGWGVYLPPRLKDSRTVLADLRAALGVAGAHSLEAEESPELLATKLELFLQQHAYTPALVLNVINPGDASLVVGALVELERRRDTQLPPVRYAVRLLTNTMHGDVGQAFKELAEPERRISEAADRLVSPGPSFLFPKLTWSRNTLTEFLEQPECFTAHATLLFDAFPVELRVARIDGTDRTSFVHGLAQDVPRRSLGRRQGHIWIRRPAPTPCVDLPAAPGRSGLLADILAAMGTLQAQTLAPNTDTDDSVAVASLDLGVSGQSLLYAVHAVSTWVLTLDQHLGLDYFDSARKVDRPGYLLDFSPEFATPGGRQLLLTTRIDAEVARIMDPAVSQLGLDPDGHGAQLLLEALRSLSGRLALRLLSAPSQVQGALGMALSRLFLGAYGLLSDAIVIPLDAHPELGDRADNSGEPRLRGDLLIVHADRAHRLLDFLLVETKCLAGTGLAADLRAEIAAQLASSQRALADAFDPALHDPDLIERQVQSWRLTTVLQFYLDRAVRYRLVEGTVADDLRQFFADLDGGYSLHIRKIGLVFRLEASETGLDRRDPDVPIWVVGRAEVDRIVRAGLEEFASREEPITSGGDQGPPSAPPAMASDQTWHDVRQWFTASRPHSRPGEIREGEELYEAGSGDSAADPPGAGPQAGGEEEQLPGSEGSEGEESESTGNAGHEPTLAPGPEYAVMLGEAGATPQYGLLGTVAAEPWRRIALDLNGCNTVSVFGVQGGGKSYTVGTIVEMAVRHVANLNRLPKPLGAVIFHYHQTQDYPPEFVTMREPATDRTQVEKLAEWGAEPGTIEDLLVLTTADTIEARRREFPGAEIEPIAFSSAELTVADWRFLMGASGNDALYLKLLNEVMRKSRSDLTLDSIRHGLASAPLSDGQRTLAETRLEFASRFIDDSRSLRSLLRPGRLLIVDLRDEFIEREQALGLFVTMLNVFSGAGMGAETFNKLIVFDEAHKYMGGTLIGQVVELIREMRHKGVSIVVASQDPINVPAAVIELSSAVILHRFNSPNWLRHIQKSLSPLAELTPSMLAALNAGEAYLWANKASDATFTRRAVKIRVRPRVTRHGGSTQTAVDER